MRSYSGRLVFYLTPNKVLSCGITKLIFVRKVEENWTEKQNARNSQMIQIIILVINKDGSHNMNICV